MKIKCNKCGVEDRGQHKKLVSRGWKIFYLGNSKKIARCKDCRPLYPDFYHEVGKEMDKIKMLNKLMPREELYEEIRKRLIKKVRYGPGHTKSGSIKVGAGLRSRRE